MKITSCWIIILINISIILSASCLTGKSDIVSISEVVQVFIVSYYDRDIEAYSKVFHRDMEGLEDELECQKGFWSWDEKQGNEKLNYELSSFAILSISEDTAIAIYTIKPFVPNVKIKLEGIFFPDSEYYWIKLKKNTERKWKILDYSLPLGLGRRITQDSHGLHGE